MAFSLGIRRGVYEVAGNIGEGGFGEGPQSRVHAMESLKGDPLSQWFGGIWLNKEDLRWPASSL